MCKAPECANPVKARGYCAFHWQRIYRLAGKDGFAPAPTRTERFWAKVTGGDFTECWTWTAYLMRTGYGVFGSEGRRTMLAHRYAYTSLIGPIPDGLEMDHLCRNRACVNPWHLEPVPHAVNVARGLGGINMSSRTHCAQGHPFDEQNTRLDRGARQCRACRAASDKRRKRKPEERRACPVCGVEMLKTSLYSHTRTQHLTTYRVVAA